MDGTGIVTTSAVSVSVVRGLGQIVWIDGLEPAVQHHGLQDAGIEQFCLFHDALHHLPVGGLGLRLDEAGHGDVALELNVFAQIQSVGRGAQGLQSNLAPFGGLDARLVPGDLVPVPQIDVEGGVDVRLQPPGHVVEASVERDFAGAHVADARDQLDFLRDLVPCAVELIRGSVSGGGDRLVVEDEGIEGDDFAVRVEDIEGELARDEAGDGRDDREGLFFAQHVWDKVVDGDANEHDAKVVWRDFCEAE